MAERFRSMSKELCPKTFQKTFDAYFLKWWIVVGIIYLLAFSLFFVPMLARVTHSELPSFVRSLINFGGASGMGELTFGFVTVGVIAVGVVALGAGSRYGMIDKWSAPRGRFGIGKAVGIVAVGPTAYGRYTLSYAGNGRYIFSPNRQDEEAVALFTHWLPKFSEVFSPSSEESKSM